MSGDGNNQYADTGMGVAIAGVVLGIPAAIECVRPFMGWTGFAVGLSSVVCGFVAIRLLGTNSGRNALPVAAIIIGVVSTSIMTINSVRTEYKLSQAKAEIEKATEDFSREMSKAFGQWPAMTEAEEEYARESVRASTLYAGMITDTAYTRAPGLRATITNNGDRTIGFIKLRARIKNEYDVVIAEQEFTAINSRNTYPKTSPLKPGYTWQHKDSEFVRLSNAPHNWYSSNTELVVEQVKFEE